MKMILIAAAAAALLAGAAHAATVNVNLGLSAETYYLYGQGNNGTGRGTFTNGQGASSFDGATSTFILTGAISSASDSRFANGTYRFVTQYDGPDAPEGGPNAPRSITTVADPNFFNYRALDSSTIMVLHLDTDSGDYTIPLFDAGVFRNGFSFLFNAPVCSGVAVAPCTMLNVGLTPGAIYSDQTFIFASFDDAIIPPPPVDTPAPASLAFLGLGLAAVGLRARRR